MSVVRSTFKDHMLSDQPCISSKISTLLQVIGESWKNLRFPITLKTSAMPPVRATAYFGGLEMSESSKMVIFRQNLV